MSPRPTPRAAFDKRVERLYRHRTVSHSFTPLDLLRSPAAGRIARATSIIATLA